MGRILSPDGYHVDFNLDADRGYGYRCWDWIRGTTTATNGRGQTYVTPRAEPEGADSGPAPTWQGAAPDATQQPLQLRYLNVVPGRGRGASTGVEIARPPDAAPRRARKAGKP
jgi:hypothetical protein